MTNRSTVGLWKLSEPQIVGALDGNVRIDGMSMIHGGRLVARSLRIQGIERIFTLCGGHIQAIYDGCLDEGIRIVDVRHEQTAGHAADADARMTGRPGVCVVTAGPGITDVVTAVANAHRGGIPMVVLAGAGPRALCDRGSLQDLDAVTLMRPITKLSVQVPETARIAEYIERGFHVAASGTPGPVFLELPLDLLMSCGELDSAAPEVQLEAGAPSPYTAHARAPHPAACPEDLERAVVLLRQARRPVILVGSQLRWSSIPGALASLADRIRIPTYVNGLARGALPVAHPNLFARSRRYALAQSDCVWVFGTPFDFRLDYGREGTFATGAQVIQIDTSAEDLGRNRPIAVAIQGDTGVVLRQLEAHAVTLPDFGDWVAQVRVEEARRQATIAEEMAIETDPPNPLRVCAEIAKRLSSRDVVIGDGGDFVATAASVIGIAWPQVWMDPGPFGTLGVGPGYAIAAQLARPDSRIFVVFGDGAFGLHALEFEAMVRQKIPVVAIIGNDAAWTQIRRGQIELYGEERAVATSLSHVRYERVVEALGGFGVWVERARDVGPAIDAALASGLPACVNVKLAESTFRKGALSV